MDPNRCFQFITQRLQAKLPKQAPLVVAIDDTIKRKSGTRIHGVSFRRDPLGPKFQTNLIQAQRFIQFSAAVPLPGGSARMIPIHCQHAPSAKKPKPNAPARDLKLYKEQEKQKKLNTYALTRLWQLRGQMDSNRPLLVVVDGSYTNGQMIKNLPEQTTLIGRIRKDAAIHGLAHAKAKTGRRPSYGEKLPTPDEIRRQDTYAWQHLDAFAAGEVHSFKVKIIEKVLWRKAGAAKTMKLVVIAPLGYQLRKNSRILYRQPAYLICTDPQLPIQQLLQSYLWRWQIEVNFRDQKTLLGMGQAQVRTQSSNQTLPATTVIAYALLWLAALELDLQLRPSSVIPPPRWRTKKQKDSLITTTQLLQQLRYECWAGSIRPSSLYDFMNPEAKDQKSQKLFGSLPDALFQAA